MKSNAILMSIRPQYASKIFDGTKTVELRRIKPKTLGSGDLIFVYVSSPVKALTGAFRVASVVEKKLEPLWRTVKDNAGVTRAEFFNYFKGVDLGVAIFIDDVWLLPRPIKLAQLQEEIKNFYPPQSFRYTSIKQISNL